MADRITHVYNREKALKTVSHYQLEEDHPRPIVLTDSIKFVKDLPYYQISGILYSLHLRGKNKWCRSSAHLKPISKKDLDVCIGSIKIAEEKSLLISQFSKDYQQVIIDIFPGFYPSGDTQMKDTVENHSYYY